MSKAKPKQDSKTNPLRPEVLEDGDTDTSYASSKKAGSTPWLLAFFLKPNKTAFWILCFFYLFWLVFLAYVAFVNVSSGNQ